MTRFLRWSVAFYAVSITLGLVLRGWLLRPFGALNFTHALHAHSHTLYFGWAGLAACALAFRAAGRNGWSERAALGSVAAVAAASFVTFLHGGYSLPSIIVSTLSLIVWSWVSVLLWRAATPELGVASRYLRVAAIYLVLAVLGALARAMLLALHVENPLWGSLAVFAFVHNFAWFVLLVVVALLRLAAPKLGITFDDRLLRRALWIAAASAWATFPLGVYAAHETVFAVVARVATAFLVVPVALWAIAFWRAARGASLVVRTNFRMLAFWTATHAAMELGGVFGLAELGTSLRHPAIAYLHVILVGTVTSSLLTLIAVELRRPFASPLLHHGGLSVMCLGLMTASAATLDPAFALPGLALAFGGAAMLVWAGWGFALRRAHPAHRRESTLEAQWLRIEAAPRVDLSGQQ